MPYGFPPKSCMSDEQFIGQRRWVFEVGCGLSERPSTTFFVTTLSPFYPASSPRRSLDPDWSFVLLQPEISFARHDLPPDHGSDSRASPTGRDIRDRIRDAFRAAGKPYHVQCPTESVMAHQVVRPPDKLSNDVVEWWWKCKDYKKHSYS